MGFAHIETCAAHFRTLYYTKYQEELKMIDDSSESVFDSAQSAKFYQNIADTKDRVNLLIARKRLFILACLASLIIFCLRMYNHIISSPNTSVNSDVSSVAFGDAASLNILSFALTLTSGLVGILVSGAIITYFIELLPVGGRTTVRTDKKPLPDTWEK
jgi:hypothetical protein